jgi:hypothetical protein
VQIAELTMGYDTAIVRRQPRSGAKDHLAARKLLAARTPLAYDQAADLGFDLKAHATAHGQVITASGGQLAGMTD